MSKIAKGIGDLSVEVVTTVIGWGREGAEIRVHSLMTGEGDANPTAKGPEAKKEAQNDPVLLRHRKLGMLRHNEGN